MSDEPDATVRMFEAEWQRADIRPCTQPGAVCERGTPCPVFGTLMPGRCYCGAASCV